MATPGTVWILRSRIGCYARQLKLPGLYPIMLWLDGVANARGIHHRYHLSPPWVGEQDTEKCLRPSHMSTARLCWRWDCRLHELMKAKSSL